MVSHTSNGSHGSSALLRGAAVGAMGLSLGLMTGCLNTYKVPVGTVALAIPRGNPVEADIAAGYEKYGATLERWGRWSKDPLYAVHWCPTGVDSTAFVPYSSNGSWAPMPENGVDDARAPNVPTAAPGSPYWVSNDADTWGDITMHHGSWVQLDQSSESKVWCWVPGVEETTARVVWREDDGVVAWAPLPPVYVDSDEDDAIDNLNLAWVFEMLGTLFDPDVNRATLKGDAAVLAHHALATSKRPSSTPTATPHRPSSNAPTAAKVTAARRALTSYVAAHPVVSNEGTSTASLGPSGSTASTGSTGSSGSSGTSASSGSSSKSSTTSSSTSSSSSSHVVVEESLPSSMALYSQMMHDPFAGMYGPPSPLLPFYSSALTSNAGHGIVDPGARVASSASSSGSSSSSSASTTHSKSKSHGSSSSSSSSSSHKRK